MADKSAIEWTDATWNPVSLGCDHCYAERVTERFHGKGSFDRVVLHEDRLSKPLHWRKPRRVFVNSMSDLFHEDVPDAYIAEVFSVMARAPQHTFQVLTKRHGRMRSLLNRGSFRDNLATWARPWPLPNVWLGVSVEDQKWADVRVPALLDTPAAVRFLSCEPLLGPVNIWRSTSRRVDWIIVGGESGPGARPMHPDWARSLRDQCVAADVPFFLKQHGEWTESDRRTATHLLHVNGYLADRNDATVDNPYGQGSGHNQDLVDRGHPGWVRVRRVGKHAAGRELDGRMWDEYPALAAEVSGAA